MSATAAHYAIMRDFTGDLSSPVKRLTGPRCKVGVE